MKASFYINRRGKLIEKQTLYGRDYTFFEISYVYNPYIPLQVTPTIFTKVHIDE